MSLPRIVNSTYDNMDFGKIDAIKEKVCSGEWGLYIQKTQLLLYLNQMNPKYSFRLKLGQSISMISFVGMILFIFINWLVSPFLLIIGILSGNWVRDNAVKYIGRNCQEDRVFLKFALSVGLVEIQKPGQ